jgi:hypothetical protein
MPLQLRDKSDFIPKLTPIANVFKLNLFNTYSLSSQSIGASVHPNPRSSFAQAPISNGGSKSSCSSKFHPRKLHSALSLRFFTSDFSLRLFVTGAFHRAFDSH